ncbi:MAG: type II secretion system protein [Clostridia bacterium]|nr:type II secretion system protein [Clostridia bacterium]
MQMINNKGVTLIILVVTIIVLMILATIAVNYGISSIREVQNNKIESELTIVQGAIIQQYTLLKSKNGLNKQAKVITTDKPLASDADRPKDLIGTRIADTITIENEGFNKHLVNYSSSSSTQSNLKYEQYYYKLDENDLRTLGIKKGAEEYSIEYEYIVNYSTGEIYDMGNKQYFQTDYTNSSPVYLEGTDSKIENQNYVFNDE